MRVTCFFDDLSSSSVPWYVFGKIGTEGVFFSFMVSLFVLFVLTNLLNILLALSFLAREWCYFYVILYLINKGKLGCMFWLDTKL